MKDHQLTQIPGRIHNSPTRDCRNRDANKARDDARHLDPKLRPTTLDPKGRSCTRRRCPRSPPYNCIFYRRRKCRRRSRSWVLNLDSTRGRLADKGRPPGCSCRDTRACCSPSAAYLPAMLWWYWAVNAHSPRNFPILLFHQTRRSPCSTCTFLLVSRRCLGSSIRRILSCPVRYKLWNVASYTGRFS